MSQPRGQAPRRKVAQSTVMARAIDHSAAAAKYIDALFQTVTWEKLNSRLGTAGSTKI